MPRNSLATLAAPVLALVILAAAPAPAPAQGVTDALSGFSVESNEPVRIESDVLEVRDGEKVAVFSGNVVVIQADTTMRTTTLKVHYTGDPSGAETGQPGAGQNISRLEANGGVVVETGDQKATGEWAVFEMATQEVTMGGDVVLSQGRNVLRGTSLVVNLRSGTSRLVSTAGGGSGRVQGLFIPGSMGQKQD